MTNALPLINVDDISIRRGNTSILSNVSFALYRGDFTVIVGPNGGGKTMLVKSILRLERISNGKITLSPKTIVGYVPQNFTPSRYIPLTVHSFLRLNRDVAKAAFDEIVDTVDIAPLLPKQLAKISQGQLQKVLIARALLLKPSLLILDEPEQNIDNRNFSTFQQLLHDLNQKSNITILMISHEIFRINRATQNILYLDKRLSTLETLDENTPLLSHHPASCTDIAHLMSTLRAGRAADERAAENAQPQQP